MARNQIKPSARRFRVRVRGRQFTVVAQRPPGGDADGICTDPNAPNRIIMFNPACSTWEQAETLLHEILHAGQWDLAEEAVNDIAQAQAEALRRAGILIPAEPGG